MSDKDSISKQYMQDKETFADAFNFFLYDGVQVIQPEQLKPLDTTLVTLPYGEDGVSVPVQRFRDVTKVLTGMTDDRAAYLLLAIENQSEQNNAQPVKVMLYDALQYVYQVEESKKSHKKAGDSSKNSAEFLSGFHETDKLLPVITLTIYFGSDVWTAPRDLHSMFSANEEVLKCVPNYWIHIISPAEIADEDFGKFHTELSVVLKYIKYARNGKKLLKAAQMDGAFNNVTKRTFEMINVMTNSKLKYSEEKEEGDMCQAIQELIEEACMEAEERIREADERTREADERTREADERTREANERAKEAEERIKQLEAKIKQLEGRIEELS